MSNRISSQNCYNFESLKGAPAKPNPHLEKMVHKAHVLSDYVLQGKRRFEGIERAYAFYSLCSNHWELVDNSAKDSLANLVALSQLQSSYIKHQQRLESEFSLLKSSFCAMDSQNVASFRNTIKKTESNLKFFDSLHYLKFQFIDTIDSNQNNSDSNSELDGSDMLLFCDSGDFRSAFQSNPDTPASQSSYCLGEFECRRLSLSDKEELMLSPSHPHLYANSETEETDSLFSASTKNSSGESRFVITGERHVSLRPSSLSLKPPRPKRSCLIS